MKRFAPGALIALAISLSSLCGSASLATPYDGADVGRPADILALRNVEITFHTAGSVLPQKNLDLMMSIYTPNAVLIDTAHGNKVYSGKDQVRAYWANVGAPFQPDHHWIGYTPAMRIRAKVHGPTASLYFECLWMDVDKNAIGAHSFSDMELAKVRGRWLVKNIKVGKVGAL
jgi:hypothetical protein